MSFPWLDRPAPATDGLDRRVSAAQRELRERSALFARLGVPVADATARLCAHVAWEFEPASKHAAQQARPSALSDEAIGGLVAEVYDSKRY